MNWIPETVWWWTLALGDNMGKGAEASRVFFTVHIDTADKTTAGFNGLIYTCALSEEYGGEDACLHSDSRRLLLPLRTAVKLAVTPPRL